MSYPTTYGPPGSDDVEEYTWGSCTMFALALHDWHGYPLVMLVDEAYPDDETDHYVHVLAEIEPGEWYMDVRGWINRQDLLKLYHDLSEPRLIEITPSELKELMDNDDESCPFYGFSQRSYDRAKRLISQNPDMYSA